MLAKASSACHNDNPHNPSRQITQCARNLPAIRYRVRLHRKPPIARNAKPHRLQAWILANSCEQNLSLCRSYDGHAGCAKLLRQLRMRRVPHANEHPYNPMPPQRRLPTNCHAVGKFDIAIPFASSERPVRLRHIRILLSLRRSFIAEARKDPSVVAISAAMLQGTG